MSMHAHYSTSWSILSSTNQLGSVLESNQEFVDWSLNYMIRELLTAIAKYDLQLVGYYSITRGKHKVFPSLALLVSLNNDSI
jgi:hypothetical protein